MAKQVQFYSVTAASYAALTSKDAGGIYFVDGGELYKSASRFGANKVFTAAAGASSITGATEGITGQIGGDILVGFGAAKVWNAETNAWVDLGQDPANLDQQMKALVSNLAFASDAGSYIIGITQDVNGAVTAHTSDFETDVKKAVGNGDASSTSNGVTVSVTTTSGKVTSVSVTAPAAKTWTAVDVGDANSYIYNVKQSADGQVSASAKAFPTLATGTEDGTLKLGDGANAKVSGWDTVKTDITNLKSVVSYSGTGDSVVTATTGNFTNLVADTATFSATTVSATSLTVNGSTVEQIADARISASTTTTVGPLTGTGAAVDTKLPTEKAVRTAIDTAVSNLAGAMHFKGTATITKTGENITVSNFSETFTPAGGDVVVDTAHNLEAVYTGSAWELLGSNSVYALDAYAPGSETVTAGQTTIGGAVHAVAGAVDTINTTLGNKKTSLADSDSSSTELATAGAIVNYVGNEIADLDATPTDAGTQGVSVAVVEADGIITGVTTTVNKATLNSTLGTTNVADKTVATSIGATGVDTALATEKAVRDAISNAALVWKNVDGTDAA